MGLVNDVFDDERARRAARRPRHRPRALLDRRRHRRRQRAADPDRLPPRADRARPQRQPRQRGDPAPRAGGGGLHLPVHLRHRGHPPPLRAQPPRAARGRDRGQPLEGDGRLLAAVPDPGRAGRRARSVGLPPARHRPARGRHDRLLRDLRARPHRRRVRARRRAGRAGGRSTATACAPSSPFPPEPARQCIFEHVYFARPDSQVFGRNVLAVAPGARAGSSRARLPPTPTSWCRCPTAAWARRSATPQESGLPLPVGPHPQPLRRPHVHRAQAVDPLLRREDQAEPGARACSQGKRVVLIDDSIVRGTTSRKIVRMVRARGRARGAPAHQQPAHHRARATTASTRRAQSELIACAPAASRRSARCIEADSLGLPLARGPA